LEGRVRNGSAFFVYPFAIPTNNLQSSDAIPIEDSVEQTARFFDPFGGAPFGSAQGLPRGLKLIINNLTGPSDFNNRIISQKVGFPFSL